MMSAGGARWGSPICVRHLLMAAVALIHVLQLGR
jgi:hypothetical protein